MDNSQQEDGDRERQRPYQHQHPTAAPENIFTNIYNVIAGARESASQEFTRFWESLGHAQRPSSSYYSSLAATATTATASAIQARRIKTPTSLRGRQFSRNSSINGRFLPDDNVRGIVKDVEIQTDDNLLQPSSMSIPHKRSASSTFEEYHIPFPVKESSKRPAFLSRRIDTSNEDRSDPPQQEPSQQETSQQEPEEEPQATSVSNKDKEKDKEPSPQPQPSPSPPPPPPPAPSSTLLSLSPNRGPIRKAMSLSPNRPLSSSTSRAAAGRFTPSPNRDIRTGSKSVRRLTMELESQFSPKFPSPYSPKRQRQEPAQDSSVSSSSPHYDRQGESSSSPAAHYRSELAATLAAQAQAASAAMTTHTLPIKSSPKVHGADEQPSMTSKEEEDHQANLLKQKELDERVNKLEQKVSIARTRVSEFSAEGGGGSSSSNSSSNSSSSQLTSPTPSHTIASSHSRHYPMAPVSNDTSSPQKTPEYTATNATAASKKDMVLLEPQDGKSTSPLRKTTTKPEGRPPFSYTSNAAPATPSTDLYKKSPVRDTRVSTTTPSPHRSSIIVSSPQQPTKEANFSPPSISYAAARAAIQEAVSRKSSSASPSGERISSVRSTMSRPFTPASVPPAPPQPPQSTSSSSSPSRVSPYKEASTYYPPKHTPSPYLQPSSGITQLKPNDQHKSKMKEVIKMIPHFNLRKADTIIGPDGVSRPNLIWLDIYDPKRRRLYDQGL